MIGYTNINEYITYLVENQININIIEFVKEVNKLKYNIDISFIDEFIELVSKDECCIHHNMLQKYGILVMKGGTQDIKRLLEQNNFLENDFRLSKITESASKGGCTHKNEYYLHPRAFKICLMRSLKTKQYARYYLLLEEAIKYFNDYQLELNKKYIIKLKNKNKENKIIIKEKDNKIDILEEKINQILNDNKQILKSNIFLENKLSKLENQNNDLIDSVEDLKEDNEEIHHKLDITIKKLDISTEERVINPNNKQKLENFVILKSRKKNIDFKYYVIRCQMRISSSKIKRLEDDKYKVILELNNITNSIKFRNYIKEKLKNNLLFEGNKFNIINIDEKVLLENIKISYNNRKNIDLDIYEENVMCKGVKILLNSYII